MANNRNPFNQPPSRRPTPRISGLPTSSPGTAGAPAIIQNKTGIPTELGDRGVATAHAPLAGQGELRPRYFTYLTKAPSAQGQQTATLYPGDRLWAKLTLTLEDAGPVSVGESQNITPVLSGKGILLETGVPMTFTIAKGTSLYIAATAVNRVKVQIEPLPWLEQITAGVRDIAFSIAQVAKALAGLAGGKR